MHYLRRTGKQDALWVSLDVFGYHLDHPPSDLYDIGGPSRYRLDARRAMLNADASSTADVMPCDLSDIKALERTLLQTPAAAPQILSRPRRAAVLNRLRKAARVLRPNAESRPTYQSTRRPAAPRSVETMRQPARHRPVPRRKVGKP